MSAHTAIGANNVAHNNADGDAIVAYGATEGAGYGIITFSTRGDNSNGVRLTGISDPTSNQDAATKKYVDDKTINGVSWKLSVQAASVGNVNPLLLDAGQTLDGVTLAQNDRVLLKDQTNSVHNGIYQINADGSAATRVDDLAAGDSAASMAVFVQAGSVNADMGFICTNNTGSAVVGTDDLVFSQFTSLGQVTAGSGLTKAADKTMHVGAGHGITVAADDISVNIDGSSLAKSASGLKIADSGVVTAMIADSNVTTAKIADANVTTAKLASDSVTTAKILDANVTAAKLASDSVTTSKILDANVTTAKIADGNVTGAKLNTDAISAQTEMTGDVADTDELLVSDNGTLKRIDFSVLRDAVFTDIRTDIAIASGGAATIQNDAITTAKILNANVTAAKLASDAVTTAKILDANVTAAKLASDAVTTAKILDANVTTAKIADGNVTGAKLNTDAISAQTEMTGDVADTDELLVSDNGTLKRIDFSVLRDAVFTDIRTDIAIASGGAATIQNDAITTAKILNANVTAAKLASDAVTTAKILDANVTAAKLASDAVTTAKILDANVTTAKILDANVTAAKLASDAVTTAKILDDNVTAAKLASDCAGNGLQQHASGALEVKVDNLGLEINADTVRVKDSGIITAKIADLAVTNAKVATGISTSKLAGGVYGNGTYNFNSQFMTNVNIDSGTIDNVAIVANSIQSTSDRRLKENIETINGEEAMRVIKETRPVKFRFKKELGGFESAGVIAQEASKVLPTIVTKRACPETHLKDRHSVDYQAYTGYLLAACKALGQRVEKLEQVCGKRKRSQDKEGGEQKRR